MIRPALVIVALLLAGPLVAFAEEDGKPALTIGLARGFGVQAMQQSARYIQTYLSEKLEMRVKAVAFLDADDLAEALAKGNIDLAWMSPAAYVRAAAKSPVILVRKSRRHGMPYYRSVIFVRADSKFQKMGDLVGKSIAWGPKNSASASLVPRAMLLEQALDLKRLFPKQLELKDHAEVCNAVYTGRVDAGASFGEERPDLDDPAVDGCLPTFAGKLNSFRIVTRSEPIPNDVVAARARFDTGLADRIGRSLEALKAGDTVLAEGFRCDGFETGSDHEFEVLRRAIKIVKER